jgi:tripartite motif-containing protein 71
MTEVRRTRCARAAARRGSPGPARPVRQAAGIATDGSNVYVADWKNSRIQKFDLDGNPVGQWTIGSSLRPQRLAVAGGKVYATTNHTDGTPDDTWDSDGITGSFGTGAGQFDYPEGLAVDGTGVYVVDQRIQQFDSTGTFVQMWGWGVADGAAALQTCSASCHTGVAGSGDGQFSSPLGIVASGGSVLVSDNLNHRLQQFSPAGRAPAHAGRARGG